jgi:ABC-type sulfate/molybdate transport systems ATPase subunit
VTSSPDTSPAVVLDQVEVRARRRTLLGPVSLSVAKGEHVLLVGPSGSGKTTLLRAIAGLARPHAGRVSLFGVQACDGKRELLAPAKRGVGMLFQNGALWPHMSVRKTLAFVMAQAGVPRAERRERIASLLQMVELTGMERRKPGTLSGGEAQRLALARALASRPQVLLLDEPLGPLDAELRSDLLDRLDEVQREFELTILHVTHDPEEARRVAGRTLRLEAGLIAGEQQHA